MVDIIKCIKQCERVLDFADMFTNGEEAGFHFYSMLYWMFIALNLCVEDSKVQRPKAVFQHLSVHGHGNGRHHHKETGLIRNYGGKSLRKANLF